MYLSPCQIPLNFQSHPPPQIPLKPSNSPVLLVCIYNKENHPISLDDLHQIFSSFGQVLKVLIFDKSRVWKAFIEFQNSTSALLAKNSLDDQKILPNQIKINVYFSELQKVQFQNKNYGGKDYTINPESNNAKDTKSQDLLSSTFSKEESHDSGRSKAKSHEDFDANEEILKLLEDLNEGTKKKDEEGKDPEREDQDKDEFNDFIDSAFQAGSLSRAFNFDQISAISPQIPLSRCSTLPELPDNFYPNTNETLLNEPPLKFRQTNRFNTIIGSHPSRPHNNQDEWDHNSPHTHEVFKRSDGPKKFSLPLTNRKPLNEISNFEQSNLQGSLWFSSKSLVPANDSHNNDNTILKENHSSEFSLEEGEKSKVLYVRGLENKNIDVQQISNLFGNFGNIIKVLFIPSKKVALVEYETTEYSSVAKDFLNSILFMKKPLKITYSKHQNINIKSRLSEKEVEQVHIEDPRNYRFKKHKNVQINPPSSTLHLSNLTRGACKKTLLSDFLAAFGKVEQMKFLHSESGGNIKNMCLVKLISVEDSVNVMIHLHNTLLDGRHVQISFTRSRI